jgi:response regulator RpfG family c-di-GMP phosphodiesterase
MSEKILCVDDDENILAAHKRQLRRQFQIETACSGIEGLKLLSSGGPFAVVVSDLRMPGMDGIEFLAKIREISPDTVRIMLTGNADLNSAIEAVNQGNIFRFLTKPCSTELLAKVIDSGFHQYRLIKAERELLDQTLKGSVKVLTEILSILDTQSFGRACILRDSVREIARMLELPDTWDIELAGMLCDIGRVTIPADTIVKEKTGAVRSEEEDDMLIRIPEIGHNLLAKIPRLESVARIVLYQDKNYDGSGFPKDSVSGEDIPLGARIIKIAKDFYETGRNQTTEFIAAKLRSVRGTYDPNLLEFVLEYLRKTRKSPDNTRKVVRLVPVSQLEVGQMLASNLKTDGGALIIAAGNYISDSLLARIRNFARLQRIQEPIRIEIVEPI